MPPHYWIDRIRTWGQGVHHPSSKLPTSSTSIQEWCFWWNIPSLDILTTNLALRYLNMTTKIYSPPQLFVPWTFSEANPSIHPKTKMEAENGTLEEEVPFWSLVIRGSTLDFNQTWNRWDVGIPTHSSTSHLGTLPLYSRHFKIKDHPKSTTNVPLSLKANRF